MNSDQAEQDVQTVPLLMVKNDKAELTHEASIGRINEAQFVQLMVKGLTAEEAAELIIKGLLGSEFSTGKIKGKSAEQGMLQRFHPS
nr:SufD family Fe-S cluster assembly protein [Thermococcus gorgonarius]